MSQISPDSLRVVLDSVFAGPAYRWVERPDPLAVFRRWFEEAITWILSLRDSHPFGFRLVLAGLVLVLVVILVHAAWVLVRTIRPGGREVGPAPLMGTRRDHRWYAREADRLAAAGRFVDAMQADFLALVMALDAARVVRFHPAKTPREYAGEAGLSPGARAEFGELVRTLYGFVFARRPCGLEDFAAWRERVEPERYASPH